jgi:hypothetical protein
LQLAVADAGTQSETADLQAALQADDPSDRVRSD